MRILGIDPGLTGGCAVLITGDDLDGPGRLWGAIDIPTRGEDAKRRVDVLELSRWIKAAAPDVAFIERAQAMPDQGSSSGFIYGRACGALEAAAVLAGVPVHFVEASVWKRHLDLPGAASHARQHNLSKATASTLIKEMARQAVIKVLPNAHAMMPLKRDHGRAEAAAIAMFGADLIESGFQWAPRSKGAADAHPGSGLRDDRLRA